MPVPVAAAASDHAGTACVLLGLSSASGSGDTPLVPHGHSTSRSNGEVPRTSQQQQQQQQWRGAESHPGHPGSVHHERTIAAAIAAAGGEEDDLAYTGKRRTQVAALPRKEWSLAEDDLIRHGVQRLGCKWRVIAAQLPGRSDDAVRNRWSRLQESMRPPEQQPPNPNGAASLAVPSIGGGGGSSSSSRAGDGAARQSGPPDKEVDRKSVPEKKERASWDKKERTSWTRAEDDIIVQSVAELGHKWFEIARRLPARQAAACQKARPRLRPLRRPPPRPPLWSPPQPPLRPLLRPPHGARTPVPMHCTARSAPPARTRRRRTDHAIRNRWSRLQSILGLNDAGGRPSPPAAEAGASKKDEYLQSTLAKARGCHLSRSESDPGGRSELGARSDLSGRSGSSGSLERRGEAGQAAEAMLGAARAAQAASGSWPQQSSCGASAPPPHTRVPILAEKRRGTNPPPPSPALAPAAGAFSFPAMPAAGAVSGDRYGGDAFELLHKLGSHNASAHASPALGPSQGAALPLPGSEQLAALPPGALPEGSAELLLLKKARVT